MRCLNKLALADAKRYRFGPQIEIYVTGVSVENFMHYYCIPYPSTNYGFLVLSKANISIIFFYLILLCSELPKLDHQITLIFLSPLYFFLNFTNFINLPPIAWSLITHTFVKILLSYKFQMLFYLSKTVQQFFFLMKIWVYCVGSRPT